MPAARNSGHVWVRTVPIARPRRINDFDRPMSGGLDSSACSRGPARGGARAGGWGCWRSGCSPRRWGSPWGGGGASGRSERPRGERLGARSVLAGRRFATVRSRREEARVAAEQQLTRPKTENNPRIREEPASLSLVSPKQIGERSVTSAATQVTGQRTTSQPRRTCRTESGVPRPGMPVVSSLTFGSRGSHRFALRAVLEGEP